MVAGVFRPSWPCFWICAKLLHPSTRIGLKDMHCRFQPEPVHAFMGTDVKMIGGGQHHTLAVDMQGT